MLLDVVHLLIQLPTPCYPRATSLWLVGLCMTGPEKLHRGFLRADGIWLLFATCLNSVAVVC